MGCLLVGLVLLDNDAYAVQGLLIDDPGRELSEVGQLFVEFDTFFAHEAFPLRGGSAIGLSATDAYRQSLGR
jgi:hypothetical protein